MTKTNKIISLLPYVLVLAADFYLLPLLIGDTGIAMVMMLWVIPFIAFADAMIYGIKRGFNIFLPVIAMILFVPTIFIHYNSSAWVYIILYGGTAAIGNIVGKIFYKKR